MTIASKFAAVINAFTGQGEQANDHLFLWSGQYPDDQSRDFILKESWLRRKIRLIKKGGKKLVQFTTNEVQPPPYPPRIDQNWKAIILTDKGMEMHSTGDYDPSWAVTTNIYRPPPPEIDRAKERRIELRKERAGIMVKLKALTSKKAGEK